MLESRITKPLGPARLGSPRVLVTACLMAALLLGLAGCAALGGGPRVQTDYDRAANFDAYVTFSFHRPLGTDEQGYGTLVSQRLKAAAQRELEARGYRYVETGGDLSVNFGARLEDRMRVTETPEPVIGGWYGYRRYGTWVGYQSRVSVDEYTQGTLTVDLVDSRRNQLVWSATAVGRVTECTRENLDAAIAGAMSAAFREYPFRAGAGT